MRTFVQRRRLRAMDSRRYWRLVLARRGAGNYVSFAVVGAMSARSRGNAVGRALLRAVLRALPAVAVAVVLLVASQYVGHWGRILRPLAGLHPHLLVRIARWLAATTPPPFDPSALLTGALAVAGTFVAVYFATVTFVVSTSYKDATRRVRDKIVRHPGTDWYTKLFAHGVAFTALALFLPATGHRASNLTLTMVGTLAVLVVVSFARIWFTLFQLLEPTSLFPLINRDLGLWFRAADRTSRRRRVSSASARFANQRITDELQTLSDLVSLVLDREYERAGERGISASFDSRIGASLAYVRQVWVQYALRKSAIATLPDWSKATQQTKDWFLTSETEVSVALATGTSLAAQEVPDLLWVERSLAGLVTRLLDSRSLRSLDRATRGLPATSQILASRGQFDEARLWRSALTFVSRTALSKYAGEVGPGNWSRDPGETVPAQIQSEEHFRSPNEASAHNLAETVVFEMIAATLGYSEYLQRVSSWLPSASASVLDRKSSFDGGAGVAQVASDTRNVVRQELALEGHRVTPDSAITQQVARAVAATAVDELEELVSFCEVELWPWVIRVGGANSLAAGASLSRAVELVAKLETAVRTARAAFDVLNATQFDSDERWPDTDTTQFAERVHKLKDALEVPTARLAATVTTQPDSDKPDHFGWAYYRAFDDLFARTLGRELGDVNEFKEKALLVYIAGDLATRRLQATVRRRGQSVINAFVSEPNVRFLQISGIALTLAQVTGRTELFEPFERVWNSRLTSANLATDILGRAAATLVSVNSLFALTSGALSRTRREQEANSILESLGVPRGEFDLFSYGGSPYGSAEPTEQLSDDLRALLRCVRSAHFEGMFYAKWLRPAAVAAGATPLAHLESELPRLGLDLEAEAEE